MSVKRSLVKLMSLMVFLAGAWPHAGLAEEPGPATPKPIEHADDSRPLRDPTAASDKLKQALRGPEKAAPVQKPLGTLPPMALKGLVQAKGKSASAMIELKGALISVSEGTQFTVQLSDGQAVTLTVIKISSEAVELEAADRKSPILVR